MNSSLLTSDRITHLKIGFTAILATALVLAVGIFAKPVGATSVGPAQTFAASVVVTTGVQVVSQLR